MMATNSHYGPGPWVSDLARPEWNPVYYNRADAKGVGFDRTPSGSDATSQYAPPIAKLFNGTDIPERFLLWFQHVAWDAQAEVGPHPVGRAGAALRHRHRHGGPDAPHLGCGQSRLSIRSAGRRQAAFLAIQEKEAHWWRDACIAYFETFSHMPMPAGHAAPPHDLAYYKDVYFPYAPGAPGVTSAPFKSPPKDPTGP